MALIHPNRRERRSKQKQELVIGVKIDKPGKLDFRISIFPGEKLLLEDNPLKPTTQQESTTKVMT
jgi:hypothetical protein